MIVRMDMVIRALAEGLDMVEAELLGATANHGKRVALLCAAMGRRLGLADAQIIPLTSCALLHDNALTEYIHAEREGSGERDSMMKLHCEYGQRNAETLGFATDISGFILYHHEWADGSGPFGRAQGNFPLEAELICLADSLDIQFQLQHLAVATMGGILRFVRENTGSRFTPRAADAFCQVFDAPLLESLKDAAIIESAATMIPHWLIDINDQAISNLASLVPRIIDYKSRFTRRHSAQIANKSWLMGSYYGYSPTEHMELYLAAVLHDIGKLGIPTQILEKPEKLTDEEYAEIMRHASLTYEILRNIQGFEHICEWASSHHEKLDGSGYPAGKTRDELHFNSRLLACIDMYQAISEERPYHPARNHQDTMEILHTIAQDGYIEPAIVQDMDAALKEYDGGDVPDPLVRAVP